MTFTHRFSSTICSRFRLSSAGLLIAMIALISPTPAGAVRIKDITEIEGIRVNHIEGFGLVIGLNGTGDGKKASFTLQSLANYLRRHDIQIEDFESLKVENVAAVIVTAELPPFARPGDRVEVRVSSIGDAENLQGGTLIMTPLRAGGNRKIYAVAQGPVSTGGFLTSQGGASVAKNHPTVGKIPGGALVELPAPTRLEGRDVIYYALNAPDFTTAQNMAESINFGRTVPIAKAINPSRVSVHIPADYRERIPEFLAGIERLPVHPDQAARIIIDPNTGTVVMGEDVRISTIALAHGNLTIQIQQTNRAVQPNPLTLADTALETNDAISAQEEFGKLNVVEEGVSLGELVRSLNAVGVTPRDLIAILQSIKSLGALQAKLEIR